MGQIERFEGEPKSLLGVFREDVQQLVDREKQKKVAWEEAQQDARERGEPYEGESYSADAVEIAVDDLTESDRAIWEEIRAGTINAEKWWSYDARFKEEMAALEEKGMDEETRARIKKSRWAFHNVAADKAQKATGPW